MSYVMLIFKVEDTIRPDEDGFDNEADRERVESAVVDPLPEALKSALVWGGSWNAVEDIPGYSEYEYEDNVASGLGPRPTAESLGIDTTKDGWFTEYLRRTS